MLLSVVIPCFNEARTIARVVGAVRACPVRDVEIIVVDDASTDGSRELLRGALAGQIDRLVCQEVNRGKGAALRAGFAVARGEFVVVQDADLEYDPAELPRLLGPLVAGQADVVFGSRFLGVGPHRVLYFWHYVGNRALTLLCNAFSNVNLTDMETCYKMFRRELLAALDLREDRFGFEPEFTIKAARRGCRIYETGISYHGRTYGEGKKIGWRDGLRAVYAIVKFGVSVPRGRAVSGPVVMEAAGGAAGAAGVAGPGPLAAAGEDRA